MAISKKQEELDDIKWYLGRELGCDPCGTFAYCKHCNKSEENPCENALNRYKNIDKKKKKKQSNQSFGDLQFRATVVD